MTTEQAKQLDELIVTYGNRCYDCGENDDPPMYPTIHSRSVDAKAALVQFVEKLIAEERLASLRESKLLRGAVERLTDLKCPKCFERIGTTLEI